MSHKTSTLATQNATVDSLAVRPLEASHLAADGALILLCGEKHSGKTCVAENIMHECVGSFLSQFPPLYIGESIDYADAYFDRLFGDGAHAHTMGESRDNQLAAQALVWRQGQQYEHKRTTFRKQGEQWVSQNRQREYHINQPNSCAPPHMLFYFDECNDLSSLQFVQRCVGEKTDFQRAHALAIVESTSMLDFGNVSADKVVFTSRLQPEHVEFIERILHTNTDVARDLVETANEFIIPQRVALVIDLRMWHSTAQHGLYILAYAAVPPLRPLVDQLRESSAPPTNSDRKASKVPLGDSTTTTTATKTARVRLGLAKSKAGTPPPARRVPLVATQKKRRNSCVDRTASVLPPPLPPSPVAPRRVTFEDEYIAKERALSFSRSTPNIVSERASVATKLTAAASPVDDAERGRLSSDRDPRSKHHRRRRTHSRSGRHRRRSSKRADSVDHRAPKHSGHAHDDDRGGPALKSSPMPTPMPTMVSTVNRNRVSISKLPTFHHALPFSSLLQPLFVSKTDKARHSRRRRR